MGSIVKEGLDHVLDPFGITSAADQNLDVLDVGLGATDILPGIAGGGIAGDRNAENVTLSPDLQPAPLTEPIAIPEPEPRVAKRQRAARSNRSRRGRSSTIMTAFNNEPLGGR